VEANAYWRRTRNVAATRRRLETYNTSEVVMNNIFKKFAAFLGVAVMSLSMYQGALFADALTNAVKTFANQYTNDGTQPFNLESFLSNPTTVAPTSIYGISGYTSVSDQTRFYFLGATQEPLTTQQYQLVLRNPSPPDEPPPPPTYTTYYATLSASTNPDLLRSNFGGISGSMSGIYSYATQTVTGPLDVVVANSIYLTGTFYTSASYLIPSSPSQLPPEQYNYGDFGQYLYTTLDAFGYPSFYQFYNLSSSGLPGYWLGAYTCSIDFNGFDFPVLPSIGLTPVTSGWAGPGALEPNYAEYVFLFGSESYVSAAAPEPHIYLLLGTLLAGVGVGAYRRRQKV